MKYITCQEASALWGTSVRRIQQKCNNGEIEGVIKEGKSWKIPYNAVFPTEATENTNNSTKIKPLPVGISDFKKATSDYYYVDKTLLIRDFLDSKPQVSLFTRPRRFGKTLTMDMLRVFFEKTEEDTSKYFKDKYIWSCGEDYTSYQGQYPVIFLTFKDVKCATWEETFDKISKLIAIEYSRHTELENSPKLSSYEKEQYVNLATCKANQIDYQMSLQILSLLLYKHYEKECIIIIDEYDTPIQQGHSCGFYEKIIDFMRNFFSGGLKDNSCLAYGFLTGILRVAKESIFSGLNNLKINSILDKSYSQYFGFTKEEVKGMLSYYGVAKKYREVCEWYDGYLFGNTEIFNPWSVINYISDNCTPKAFWQSTGSNDIIGEIISSATTEVTENLHNLLTGNKVTTYIDTNVIYPEVNDNPYLIYSFLLISGYLKVDKVYPQSDGNYMCDVAIPNQEISFVYAKEVLSKTGRESIAVEIQQAIFKNDAKKLQQLLEKFMIESISSFDGTNEGFYHGMMLGLCAIVSNKYRPTSNRESGLGRFDIQLYPINKSNPGFIYEFKHTKNVHELDTLAQKALEQIEEKHYDTALKSDGINNIIKIGIAFCGKKLSIKSL
ncbi:MAG: AAA family ATPase [Candidatus Coproplasma sp.]